MEQQFLSLFESAKKSADIVATSASIFPEVYRCLDALDQLKRHPVTSSRVLVSTPVAKEVQYLTKHRVKMIRTAASCLLDTWSRQLHARNPAIDGKTQPAKGRCGSRTGTLVVKIQGRVIGRVKVNMPFKTENKIKEEKEKGFSCFKKPPNEPVRVKVIMPIKTTEKILKEVKENGFGCFKKPPQEPTRVKVIMPIMTTEKEIKEEKENGFSCFKKPPQEPAICCTKPGKDQSIRRCFKKPSTKRITQQENVKDFCSFKKPPQEPFMRCIKPGEVRNIRRRCFKKPSTKRITQQENVKDFCSFKKPSEEPVKCSDGLRSKVRHILVESLCRVANEVKDNLIIEAVSLRDPICVAADVESVMFEKMGPFSGTKKLKYRSILYNMKDPKNPDLRRKVLLGQIKPEKLVTMTSEEMASNQRQFENGQIRKKSLKEMKNAEQEHKSVDRMEY